MKELLGGVWVGGLTERERSEKKKRKKVGDGGRRKGKHGISE